jgi:disulfide bond formation protein DsbB
MNNETFELFFSMLSVALLAGTLVVLAARVLYTRSASARSIVDAFAPWALPLAAAVTTTCALGSLYFSEIVNYKPCIMCWFQRTMMYPLAVILIVAALTKDKKVSLSGSQTSMPVCAMLKCRASLCGLRTLVSSPFHSWRSLVFLQFSYSPPFPTHKRNSHE